MKYSKKYQLIKKKYKTLKKNINGGSHTNILYSITYNDFINYNSYRFVELKEIYKKKTRNTRLVKTEKYLEYINNNDDLYGRIRNEMLHTYNIINSKRIQLLDNYLKGLNDFHPYYMFHILGSNSKIEKMDKYPNISGGGGICIKINGIKYLLTCSHCFENTIYLKNPEDTFFIGNNQALNNERLVLFNNGIICSCKCILHSIDVDIALCEITRIYPNINQWDPESSMDVNQEYSIDDIEYYDLLENFEYINENDGLYILGNYGQDIIKKNGKLISIDNINEIEYKHKPCEICFKLLENLNLIDKGGTMCRSINGCTKQNFDKTKPLLKKYTDNFEQEELKGGYDIMYMMETEQYTIGGDSGYPIYNKNNKIIGIHNGDDNNYTPTLSTGISLETIIKFIQLFKEYL